MFKLKIWNVKNNYYAIYYELLNEHRLESSLLPWKVYLIQYLRKQQQK